MLLGIDHLVIAVLDADAAALLLERELGLRSTGGGQHEELGTFNRLVWLGDSYLELIAVVDRSRAQQSWLGRPTLAALDSDGGLATFALASDDLGADRDRLRAGGSRLALPRSGARRRTDGRTVRWQVALPPRLGPTDVPFLIEHDATGAEWTLEDRASRAPQQHPIGGPVRLTAIEIPTSSVAALAQGYRRELGLVFRPSPVVGGARDCSVGDQIIRLRHFERGEQGSAGCDGPLRSARRDFSASLPTRLSLADRARVS